jgi:hypothetical protein
MDKKDTWVVADYDYNIIFEGTFEKVAEYAKNAPAKMMMSKKVFEGVKERKNGGKELL